MYLDDDTVDELPAPPRKHIPAADRELLELAARAIAVVRVEDVDGEQWLILHFADGTVVHGWNPLLFYGDTFELGARLRIGTDHSKFCVHACDDHGNDLATEDVASDRVAASARAVVRAAAEIGKAMP